MAASADELLKNDNFQIPLIDLQRFCQDELNTAARLFGDFPETKFSSMVSPKIDKSIFNESAGSRRQTYSGRGSRRRKKPIPNSHAEEDSQEISMSSLVNLSSGRGKSGSNKNSSESILDLVGKFLYLSNKEEKNRLIVRSSLSSHVSEERDIFCVPLFRELKKKEDFTASPNIKETENICEISVGDPEMEGGILNIQNPFENAEGLEEDRSKVLDNARPYIPNARKTPQVSKEDSELESGIGRVRMLSQGCLERTLEDQSKVVVNSSPSRAESGDASAVLGRDTEGGIWGIRKLLNTSERLQEGQYKVVVNESSRLLEANCTSEVLTGSLEMEEDIGEIKNSTENIEGVQVSGEIIEHSVYVRPEQESKVSGEENIDTQHRLQVWSQESKGDVTEKANVAAELKEEKLANRKNEHDLLRQISHMKKQKISPADDFLESWRNRLPNGWKVEVGLQGTESGKYDYYHNFVSPDGVPFPELNETSKYESSLCCQENDVKRSSGTIEIEFCNISPACYRGSNQRSDISYEEDRNKELNTSSKLDSPESMSIPLDSDEARVEAQIYACKLCGNNFNCYRHYVGHVAAHAPTSHRKRGRPRLRGKLQNVPLPEKKEDKDDKIVSNENLQSTGVKESDNPDKLKGKVGRPRVRDSDFHKEMYCNTGDQSGCVVFYANQAGSKENVNEPQNYNIMDMDCGHAILSGGTAVSINTAGPRKPGQPTKIKEPIFAYNNKDDDRNHINSNRDDFVDTDCGHVMQSAGTPVLVNTFGRQRKPGRMRKTKEPICGNGIHDDDRNYTGNDRDEASNYFRSNRDVDKKLSTCKQSVGQQTSIDRDACEKIDGPPRYGDKTQSEVHYVVDADCGHDTQSAGTPVLVNTVEPKRKPERARIVGLKRKPRRPGIVGLKRKPGRPRKIKEPICGNDNHDDERNCTENNRDEANNCFRSYQDVEENLSMCEQSAVLQNSIDRDACEKIDGPPRYGDKIQGGVHYFGDTDCDHAMQSAGTPVLGNIVGTKRKRGRPRKVRPKRKSRRPRKVKEPTCSNDNHDNERNYSGNDRDDANNSFRSYQDVQESLSMCKQSVGLQTSIDRDAFEKIDGQPRCRDKTQDGMNYSADTDCGYAMQSADTPVLVNTVGQMRKPGLPRKIKEPICSNDNHDDERNCTGNDRDEVTDSFWSYKDVKENLSMCKQSACVQTSIDRDACEKIDGLPRYGHKTQDEVHCENSIKSVGVLELVDQDGKNNWAGQQRLRDDNKDTAGDLASTDPSLKRDDWSRLKDKMQDEDMDCSNDSQPLDAQGLVTQVGEKKKLEWSRKFHVPVSSDSKLDDKINNCSSSGNQDEVRHCQYDNHEDEMARISLDGELKFSKIDQSMHVMAPVFVDKSQNVIGMQKHGKITQDEEMPCGKTFQYIGLMTNLDPDEQSKWFEQPRVKYNRQDAEPSYQRVNQWADSKIPIDSASPLEFLNVDRTLQEHGTYQNISKTTDGCFAEAETLFPAVNVEKLDPNKITTVGNAQVPFVDLEIKLDPSQFVVCQWCDQDFDFSSMSHLGSLSSWICPGCKTVNNGNSL